MSFLFARLREPSTWASLGVAFAASTTGAPAGATSYLWGATLACAVVGILLGEKPKPGEH